MKVIDCLKLAAGYLGDSKMAALIEKLIEDNAYEGSKSESDLKALYLNSFNVALSAIVVEELGLTYVQKVVSDNNSKIDYAQFDEKVYEVLKVVDKVRDVVVDFYALPFGLHVPKPNRAYLVRFKYLPAKVEGITDEVELSPLVLPEMVAKLMVSDILLSKNSYDEANIWRNEYKRAITNALSRRSLGCMPQRKLI